VNGGAEMAVELSLKDILRADGPAAELELRPHDVVRVEHSQDRLVYVAGEVNTPGAIQLQTANSLYITQALAMAGGYKNTAILDKAILWSCCDADQKVRMSLIDLKKILTGKAEDQQLKEGDYLLIRPKSQRNVLPMIASFAALASAMGTLAIIHVQ
jgi:protein involved in polysaccharide export with SLBB domain